MEENTDTGVPLLKKNKINSRNLGYKDTSYVRLPSGFCKVESQYQSDLRWKSNREKDG